jgi:Fe-S-cluster containining protein
MPTARAQHWLAAVHQPAVRLALERVYAEAAEAIRERGPACWASGRCCSFDRTGHRLYVTGLEAAYLMAGLASETTDAHRPHGPGLTLPILTNARARGGCPFQNNNLCTVHAIKPLGCRVYFCDQSSHDWQHELSERLLLQIRALHDAERIDYAYGEWRDLLACFITDDPRPGAR